MRNPQLTFFDNHHTKFNFSNMNLCRCDLHKAVGGKKGLATLLSPKTATES